MLTRNETVDRLSYICKIDIDAVDAYTQVIKNIDEEDQEIAERLKQYRVDHERHILVLTDLIKNMGENPPERSKNFTGFTIEGFTLVSSLSGTEGAFRAMETNEKLTNERYDDARKWDLNPEIVGIMEEFYSDEKTHLTYIRDILDTIG